MRLAFFLFSVLLSTSLFSQNEVDFKFSYSGDTLIATASIENGWHLYAANLPNPNEGPLPTEFIFTDENILLGGDIIEPEGIVKNDEAFGINVKYFEKSVVFKLPLKNIPETRSVIGTVYYMVCNEGMCMPKESSFAVRML